LEVATAKKPRGDDMRPAGKGLLTCSVVYTVLDAFEMPHASVKKHGPLVNTAPKAEGCTHDDRRVLLLHCPAGHRFQGAWSIEPDGSSSSNLWTDERKTFWKTRGVDPLNTPVKPGAGLEDYDTTQSSFLISVSELCANSREHGCRIGGCELPIMSGGVMRKRDMASTRFAVVSSVPPDAAASTCHLNGPAVGGPEAMLALTCFQSDYRHIPAPQRERRQQIVHVKVRSVLTSGQWQLALSFHRRQHTVHVALAEGEESLEFRVEVTTLGCEIATSDERTTVWLAATVHGGCTFNSASLLEPLCWPSVPCRVCGTLIRERPLAGVVDEVIAQLPASATPSSSSWPASCEPNSNHCCITEARAMPRGLQTISSRPLRLQHTAQLTPRRSGHVHGALLARLLSSCLQPPAPRLDEHHSSLRLA
jgi:hypothetical protein